MLYYKGVRHYTSLSLPLSLLCVSHASHWLHVVLVTTHTVRVVMVISPGSVCVCYHGNTHMTIHRGNVTSHCGNASDVTHSETVYLVVLSPFKDGVVHVDSVHVTHSYHVVVVYPHSVQSIAHFLLRE